MKGGPFPDYGPRERRADAAVHLLGTLAAPLGAVVLLAVAADTGARAVAAAAVYSLGLVASFGFSAAYNLARAPGPRERLRRLDRAAIYPMIAGTYTPFALVGLGGASGGWLLGAVWAIAAGGAALAWCRPRRLERVHIGLYLALGWIGLVVLDDLLAALAPATLWLLLAGGVLYTAGVGVHLLRALPYHNALWHLMVVAGATCHWLAVLAVVA